MINQLFLCCLFLFTLSLLGIILNRKNLIVTLICIEMALLAVNLNFIVHSIDLDDISDRLGLNIWEIGDIVSRYKNKVNIINSK